MGILSAENNTAYTANNECKIYIIKQIDYDKIDDFKKIYVDYINSQNTSLASKIDNLNVLDNYKLSLTPLLTFDQQTDPPYTEITFSNTIDKPKFANKCWFYTPLFELRNCPLLDFSKYAYVFQINGQTKSGLSNVVSFTTNFSVNGQSSCEIIINNKDFKYNFKYFNDPNKYTLHLRPFFDTNDIIIVRYQKKNTDAKQLTGSFVKQKIEKFDDPYIGAENDPLTTIFTGYINDVNNSFSFNNGKQTMSIVCTGPSKKLTWTRLLSNNAVASKDSASALLPISAFTNPQTLDDNNKVTLKNKDVIKNVITRTMSGVLNIPEVQKAYEDFLNTFDINANLITDKEKKYLEDSLNKAANTNNKELVDKYNKEINDYSSKLNEIILKSKQDYNNIIMQHMNDFSSEENGIIYIKKHTFLNGNQWFAKTPSVFEINGTTQPAYQYAFNNFQSLFQSDFSTVYQFIKGIADNLQFNFYDDPYGTIHFSVPDMTLLHLEKGNHPNNITQLISFSETQNTENIANVQYGQAQYTYSVDMNMINTVTKDYQSIAKYGEKMMQPFSMVGITSQTAIRYASRMRMYKYNRKALSNIRISIQGEPQIQFDKYAYIKELRKLFYIESYSHSYNAGGDFSTSINGTYTREILANAECENSFIQVNDDVEKTKVTNKKFYKNSFEKLLRQSTNLSDVQEVLNLIEFNSKDMALNDEIYAIYVRNWAYPRDNETLKMEIGSMYTEDKLRQCYLDGFFWAIPFDVNPYDIALNIQNQELKNIAQLNKTMSAKEGSKVKKENLNNRSKAPSENEPPYCLITYKNGDKGTKTNKELPKFPTLLDIIKVPSIIKFKLPTKQG